LEKLMTTTAPGHYLEPGWFSRRVFNRFVAWLTRRGLSVWGSRILRIRGRSTGEWRSVPVNPLDVEGRTYLVAPRGETQWVRNLRVAGAGELCLGRATSEFVATELAGADKPAILRLYLARWKWEVGQFFDGVGPDATDTELAAISDRHPVFVITGAPM
jgi:hypothetical protein